MIHANIFSKVLLKVSLSSLPILNVDANGVKFVCYLSKSHVRHVTSFVGTMFPEHCDFSRHLHLCNVVQIKCFFTTLYRYVSQYVLYCDTSKLMCIISWLSLVYSFSPSCYWSLYDVTTTFLLLVLLDLFGHILLPLASYLHGQSSKQRFHYQHLYFISAT